MASSTDFVCDLTGEVLRLSDLPIVVRIQVGVVPGAVVDPQPHTLHPFVRRMLFHPDGGARPGVLELGARAFAAHVAVDLAALEPAFGGPPLRSDEAEQLRATVAVLQAEQRRAVEERRKAEAERDALASRVASLNEVPRETPQPRLDAEGVG